MALQCAFTRGNSLKLIRYINQIQQIANSSGHASGAGAIARINQTKIGNREVVGYGLNGNPNYFDRADVPLPSIRFREVTPDIQVLREKEKSDWNKLSVEEKKALYRASFCQTLAEVHAPTGDWKAVLGMCFMCFSAAMWLFLLAKIFVYSDLPHTFDPQYQKDQLKRIIDLRMNPIEGLASKWDYEKGQWKEK